MIVKILHKHSQIKWIWGVFTAQGTGFTINAALFQPKKQLIFIVSC